MGLVSEQVYRPRSSDVVSEIIDGEAIIMDLRTGHYFSARDVACFIWERLCGGQSHSAVCAAVVAQFDVDAATLAPEMDRFIGELVTNDLIVAGEAGTGAVAPAGAGDAARRPFTPPRLSVYTDMADLLLLDPIHDVEEAGWPTRKPAAQPSDKTEETPPGPKQ